MTQFVAHTGAMNGWQGLVDGVSSQVAGFATGGPDGSDLTSSHGAIGFPMQNAFSSAQESRSGALGATQAAASRMAELLGQASKAYERGDLAAAGSLKAQADQIEGAGAPASGSTGSASSAAGSASGGAGQMMGQFGQMAGQMMQSMTQPLQGLSQAMGQVPQQVMQGVQGIVEAATQAAGDGADAAGAVATTGAEAGGTGAEQVTKAGGTDGHDGAQDGSDRDRAPVDHRADRQYTGDQSPQTGASAVPTQVGNVTPRPRH